MSMTFCIINVKHVKDNKEVHIKYKLNKLTSVCTSYTARNRWVFNSLLNRIGCEMAARKSHCLWLSVTLS